jgi:hypothetical protein
VEEARQYSVVRVGDAPANRWWWAERPPYGAADA